MTLKRRLLIEAKFLNNSKIRIKEIEMKCTGLGEQHIDSKRANYKFLELISKIFNKAILKNIAHKQIRMSSG
ncbi:MAG: hypothetical protein ACP5HX_08700 [Thermoproteota archaeon]